jgi:serine kinase of HPr protein (carbohydrate metabolism regulator)
MSNSETAPETVHGTAVSLGGEAVLVRGASGSGKSDLALRCLALAPSALIPLQAKLVADDRVLLERTESGVMASAPAQILGKLEVRGIGIIAVEAVAKARLVIVVDLVPAAQVERFPLSDPKVSLAGSELPLLRLAAFEASSAVKLLMALQRAREALTSP